MVIANYDSWTFRPEAIMIVGKAEIIASGSFRISHQYWGNNLYRLRSIIINSRQLPTQPEGKSFVVDQTTLDWMVTEEFRMRYLDWQELVNVNYEQISFLRLLGLNWTCFEECLWQTKATDDKNSRQLSLWRRDGGQPDEDQNEQQQ